MLQHLLMIVGFGALSVYGLVLALGTAALGSVESRMPAEPQAVEATAAALSQEIEIWESIPGLRNEAAIRRVQLALLTVTPDRLDELKSRIEDKLRRRPAAPAHWLLLAQVRLAQGAPMPAVIQAFQNSILTGRFEQRVMIDRVSFAMTLWPIMEADLQRQVITELGYVGGRLSREALQEVKDILAAYPPEDRDAIAHSLMLRFGTRMPGWVKTLGLEIKAPG